MNEGEAHAGARVATFRAVVVKATVTHTITYFVFGLLALFVFDYDRLYAETELAHLMRPTTDPVVMAGLLFQPIRASCWRAALRPARRVLPLEVGLAAALDGAGWVLGSWGHPDLP